MKTGLRKEVFQSVIPSINKLQHAVSQWVIPYCPFPAFPSWSPLPPRFSTTPSPEPRAWKKVLSVSIQVADPGSPVPWPRNRDQSRTSSVSSALGHFEEPRGQGTYMTYAAIKLPTNFQNSPAGIKHLQPAEGSVRKFRLPQCSIYPTSTCPISVRPNGQTWTKHKQINNTHSDSTNTLLRRIHGDFDFLRKSP